VAGGPVREYGVRTSWLPPFSTIFPVLYSYTAKDHRLSGPCTVYDDTADTVNCDAAYTLYSAIHSPSGDAPVASAASEWVARELQLTPTLATATRERRRHRTRRCALRNPPIAAIPPPLAQSQPTLGCACNFPTILPCFASSLSDFHRPGGVPAPFFLSLSLSPPWVPENLAGTNRVGV